MAAENGHVEVARLLVERKADVNLATKVYEAVECGADRDQDS